MRRTQLVKWTVTALVTALTIPGLPALGYRKVIRYADFSDTSALRLNGTAAVTGGALRLTSGLRSQAGTAWSTTRLNTEKTFQTTFDVSMTGGVTHADGLAFVLQTDGPSVVGGRGGSIGYGGLTHSVAVELDTYRNPNDPDNSHVAIVTGGRSDDPATAVSVPLFGQTLRIRINYDARTKLMKVRLRSVEAGTAEVKLLTQEVDLREALGSRRAWMGFTAATGQEMATQEIHNWTVKVAR